MMCIPYPSIKFRQNSTKTPDNFFISPFYQRKCSGTNFIGDSSLVENKHKEETNQTKKTSIGRGLKKKKTVKTLR